MQVSLCVADLISTGAPSKGCLPVSACFYVSTHVCVWVWVCVWVCVCGGVEVCVCVTITTKCADMPAHSTLNASLTFSSGSLCPHACPKHTGADKGLFLQLE